MLKDIPDDLRITLIIVIIIIVISTVFVLLRVIQGKLSIRLKGIELEAKNANDDSDAAQLVADHLPHLKDMIQCMLDALPLIRAEKWHQYLTALKDSGIDAQNYVNHIDAQHYYQCLGNIIWSGNGISSYMSIIHRAVVDGLFIHMRTDHDFEAFVDRVMARLKENEEKYLDQHYLTHVSLTDGTIYTRVIDRDELYRTNEEGRLRVRELVKDVFVQAKEAGCRE